MQMEGVRDVPKIISACRNLCKKPLEGLFDFYVKKFKVYVIPAIYSVYILSVEKRLVQKKVFLGRLQNNTRTYYLMTNPFFDL
jgi:hypothetical protein